MDEKGAIDWADPSDPANPFNWPKTRKWLITLFACMLTFMAAFNSASIAAAATNINAQFGISDANFPNSYWSITSWNLFAALVPLAGLPLMETYGLRPGYLISHFMFAAFILPQALAPNYATLIVTRGIAGAFGGILYNGAAGWISELWLTDAERALPISWWCLNLVGGATLGPAVAGLIVAHLSWRWIFWVQFIWWVSFFPVAWIVLQECRGPIVLSRLAKDEANSARIKYPQMSRTASKEAKQRLFSVLKETIVRPACLFFTEGVCFSIGCWTAFAVSLIYSSTQSIGQVYSELYGFTPSQTSYLEVAVFVGACFGFLACFPQNKYYVRSAAYNKECPGVPCPEARLPLGIIASVVGMVGGLFWYGWASYSYVPWIVPTIGLGLIGFATMGVFQSAGAYITDAYPKYTNSVVAATACGENIFVSFLPLSTQSMYRTLGFQWASSLLGFVAMVLSCAPIFIWFYGRRLRERSPFMSSSTYT